MFHRQRQPAVPTAAEAELRIRKMINFILNDAHDKAYEIKAQTEQDALHLYQQRITAAQQQLRRDYDEKRRQVDAAYKKRQARQLLAAELEVQTMRWEKVRRIQRSVHHRLTALCQPQPSYGTFMAYLLVEALLKVADEDSVQLCYRKEDAPVMAAARERGMEIAAGLLRSRAGVETSWHVELMDSEWLPPGQPITVDAAEKKDDTHSMQSSGPEPASLGGLLLLADNGRIRVNNTVDQRLVHAVHAMLPVIRVMLWADDKGYVHRIVEQRRGKRSTRRRRVVRWERHEAHIIAVEEQQPDDDGHEGKEGGVGETGGLDSEERKEGKEEKVSEQRWWREHELEMKASVPTWHSSRRNSRQEQPPEQKYKSGAERPGK